MRRPNVYEMYVANENRAGFWIQRNSWGGTCAYVRLVGGREAGDLPGVAPYFSNLPVHADLHDLSTGVLKERRFLLSCPGTFAYHLIGAPRWAPTLDGRATPTTDGVPDVFRPK